MATPELVVEAARAGDRRATDVLARAGEYLGIGMANVAVIVGPERIVVGGGVAAAGELILEPARRELARRLTVIPSDLIPIVPAELGLRAGAIGAALWATRGELESSSEPDGKGKRVCPHPSACTASFLRSRPRSRPTGARSTRRRCAASSGTSSTEASHGIMTTGGTGEFPHLSREERRRVTEIAA